MPASPLHHTRSSTRSGDSLSSSSTRPTRTSDRHSSRASSETEWTEAAIVEDGWSRGGKDGGVGERGRRGAVLDSSKSTGLREQWVDPAEPEAWYKRGRPSTLSPRRELEVDESEQVRKRGTPALREVSPARFDRLVQTLANSRLLQMHVRRQWWDEDVATLMKHSASRSSTGAMEVQQRGAERLIQTETEDDDDDNEDAEQPSPDWISISDCSVDGSPVVYTSDDAPTTRSSREPGMCSFARLPYGSETASELLVEAPDAAAAAAQRITLQTTLRLHARHRPLLQHNRRSPRLVLTSRSDVTESLARGVSAELGISPRRQDEEEGNPTPTSPSTDSFNEEASQHARLSHLTPETSHPKTLKLLQTLTALQHRHTACAVVLVSPQTNTETTVNNNDPLSNEDESDPISSTRLSLPYVSAALGRPPRDVREAVVQAVARQTSRVVRWRRKAGSGEGSKEGEEEEEEEEEEGEKWEFETPLPPLPPPPSPRAPAEDAAKGTPTRRGRCRGLFDRSTTPSSSSPPRPAAWVCFFLPSSLASKAAESGSRG